MKKRKIKQRRNNLLEVLSILKEGTAEQVTDLLKNIEKNNIKDLVSKLLTLEKDFQLSKQIKLDLNQNKEKIKGFIKEFENELKNKKTKISLTPKNSEQLPALNKEKDRLEKLITDLNQFLKDAEATAKEEEEISKSLKKDKPYMDFFAAISRVYQPVTLEAGEIYKKEDGEEFYDSQIKQKATESSKEEFYKKFLPELQKRDKRTYQDYENYKNGVEGTGEKYKEYLNIYSNDKARFKEAEVKKFLSRFEIPKIPAGQVRHIPPMVIPPEPPSSPASVLGQIGKGLRNIRAATGLEENLIRQESLQESLQLKKLSLKEAMEKEYD